MKKRFGFGIAALALLLAFGIGGCPTGGDDGGSGLPSLVWPNAEDALTFERGDNIGDIKYSIVLTEPVADSYTLYYVQGAEYDAAKIQSGGKTIEVPSSLNDKISNLVEGETYSAVVVAKKSGYADTVSGVKTAEPRASGYLTKIRIINIPVGKTGDGQNEDKEVAFVWPQVRSNTFSGVGVWGGKFKADSEFSYPDNEIKETPEGSGLGSVTTELYATSELMLFLLTANQGQVNAPLPSKQEVSGAGTIVVQYKYNNNQTTDITTMGTREWSSRQYKDDPATGYLELDWNDGVEK